ncbi:MAG: hypothetical protein JWP37_655 [Mucilaginibacter sp.]|nr:hypothetical protein [Mucilaginibacter sp.]
MTHLLKIQPFTICMFFILCLPGFVEYGRAQQKVKPVADTALINQNQRTNAAFNNVYRENVRPGFFGNEYGNPIRDLLVADISPNVVLFQSKKSRFFFVFSPRVKVRLLSGYKSPVRSPSYMPNGTLYTRLNEDPTHPKFFSLVYSHHSNGQEGPTLNSDGTFDRGNGKFTTNFYQLNYQFGKNYQSATLATNEYASIGAEIHTGLFNTGYSKQLAGKYGFVRTNGSWMYSILKDASGTDDHYHSMQRLQLDLMYIWDKDYNYTIVNARKRLNTELKYYYQLGFMENVALMIGAGYRGQDDYNIYFQDSYPYIAIGLASGVSFDLHKKHHYSAL